MKTKIFKSGFCEKLKLLLIPIGLLIGSLTMQLWAGGDWFIDNMWQVYGYNPSTKTNGWHWTSIGKEHDCSIGVITSSSPAYTIKGLGVNISGSGVKWVGCQWWYPDGTNNWATIGTSGGTNGNAYFENTGIWDYTINKNADPGDYYISIHFWMNDGGSNYNQKQRKITWTIPGFKTDNPTSFSFGSNNPVGRDNVAKIGIVHYGDWPTLGGCVLTGTDKDNFEVIDIDYTGVTVVFTPSSTGSKSATLTITDTYSKQWTISLSGTGAANTATTRLYFNNYNYNSNWITDGALPRFTCEYTTGIYTRYPMTKCANSTYNWYADVEIKGATVNVDRYKPSSPYNTWNTVSLSGLNASNPYAVLDNYSSGTYYGFATNHPYNDVSGGNIYYDNSKSGLTNTLYVVIGHDYKMSNGGIADEYSKAYALGNIGNTKLYYLSLSDDTWHDADYYAFIGASSAPSAGEWGSDDLSSKASSSSYTGIFRDIMDLESGSSYLGYAATKTNGALSMTKSPTLNTTQTFNYALSTDGGSTYPALTSGPNTPGQLSMSAFEFTDATCTAVTSKSAQTLSANATTYSKAVSSVAYTGTTVLTESNTREGYTFMGWYKGNSTIRTNSSTHSFTYYPQGDSTYTARYKAHRYTIAFNKNDAQYSSAPAATGSMTSISNVVYDQNVTLTENVFEREGYTFAGWNREADGSGASYTDEQSVSNLTATDGATVTLYAQWTEDKHTITVQYRYGEEEIASDGSISNVGITTTQAYTAPSIAGYTFSSWTLPVSGVTIVTGSTETASIAINATADATIVANYTPTVYNGKLKESDGTEIGEYSVIHGSTTLTVTSAPTKQGYHVYRYYLTYDGKDYVNPIAEPSETATKQLIKNVSITTTEYTDNDGKWEYVGEPEIYVMWEENTYNVELDARLGTGTSTRGTESFTATTDQAIPAVTMPTQVGYDFKGYYTSVDGDLQVLTAAGAINLTATDYFNSNGTWKYDDDVTLYAHWDPVALTFNGTTDGDWGTASNWSPACVPTSGHDVTISAEVTVSGSAVAKSVTIEDGGKVNIAATGVLEVEGAVASDNADKLVINTSSSSQGALICDNSGGTTQATVNLTTQYANGKFQFIAIPLNGVSVASTFSGKGKYTYGWKYGEGWERRGYYDAFTAFEAVLLMGQTYTSFAGALVSTNDFSASLSYDASKVSGDVYMYGNSWTAPIRHSDMTLSGISSINILNGSSNGWDGVVSGDVIPALQGYAAVVGSSGGSISIDYDDAVRNAATPNASLRAPKRNVSDPIAVYVTGNEMQTRIRLFEDEQFTDELDEGYEALYMEGNGYAGELYAMGAKKMNVLATSDLEGTVVGFVPGQATEYTISFAGEGKGYYLNDIEAQESTLISEENTYTFLSGTNDAARFIVSRTPISKTTTGNEAIYDGVKARKQMIDGVLYIIKDGRMYNAEGMIVK